MQLEQIITMCFFGYGEGQDELQSNLESYRRRYLNIGRHPNLAMYEEMRICNRGKDSPEVVRENHPIEGKAAKGNGIGVYLIAHGTGGNSEPGVDLIAKLMAEQLGGRKPSKINLAVCQGAIKLNAPQSNYNQNDFDNGTLKKFCDALLKSENVLANGLLVSAYAVNVETFDIQSPDTKKKLAKDYVHSEPHGDGQKVHTVRADHKEKKYDRLHPEWVSGGFVASDAQRDAWQAIWSAKRIGYAVDAKKNPSIKDKVDEAVSIQEFSEMCGNPGLSAVASDFRRRHKNEIDTRISVFLQGRGASDEFISKAKLYVRNKMAMRYDGKTFKVCSLSDYTDSAHAREWLDLVTQHMTEKGKSPMGLVYTLGK